MANAPFNITCSEGAVGWRGGDTGIGEMERKKGDECSKRVGRGRNRGKLRNNAYNRKTAKVRKPSRSRECKVREAGGLDPVKRTRNKHLNSSLSFRQAALTFCLPGATSCLT